MTASSANRRRLARAGRSLFGTRSRLVAFLAQARSLRVPGSFRGTRWLSVAIVLLFLVQALTGALLALYYSPDPASAYASTRSLLSHVTAGWLVRSVHHWAADLMVACVLLHLLVVFFRRAYAAPRQFQWVLGALLLLAVLAFRFTGRFLPMDTLGRDATRAGLELLDSVPLLGPLAASWLRGGEEEGAKTLARFFGTHALILPWVTAALLGGHLWLVKRHGLAGGRGGTPPLRGGPR